MHNRRRPCAHHIAHTLRQAANVATTHEANNPVLATTLHTLAHTMAKYVAAAVAGGLVLGGLYTKMTAPPVGNAAASAAVAEARSDGVMLSAHTAKIRQQAAYDHERAGAAVAKAQEAAAAASAAVAAAALLRDKEAEAKRRAEAEAQLAADLHAAAKEKHRLAAEATELAGKDAKYLREAEREAGAWAGQRCVAMRVCRACRVVEGVASPAHTAVWRLRTNANIAAR